MNVYRSSTTMQMDAKYKAVKQSRCMTRVITALKSPINKTVSSRCDPKPGSLTGDAVQFSVGRQPFFGGVLPACPSYISHKRPNARVADDCVLLRLRILGFGVLQDGKICIYAFHKARNSQHAAMVSM